PMLGWGACAQSGLRPLIRAARQRDGSGVPEIFGSGRRVWPCHRPDWKLTLMATSTTTTAGRATSIAIRIGLALAAVLAVGDVLNAVTQFTENGPLNPFAWGSALAALITFVLIPFAWRGSSGAGWGIAIVRVLSSLTGLPAFFIPGVPAPFVVAAAGGILLAVLSAVLIVVRKRTP
ncbi:MAG: hypothetical protein Q8M65_02425, partial [Rhodoglobus sp.]|nr:hypothetical protein [Rhodoglobus sp.]